MAAGEGRAVIGSRRSRWRGRAGCCLALAVALPAGPGRAEEAAGGARSPLEPIPTFAYQDPQPGPYRLRAGLELLTFQAISFAGYLVVDPKPSIPGLPDPMTPWDKLLFKQYTWLFEADDIRHNYYGHPLAGMLYYLTARGNRLSVLESWLWTTASSLVWELAEYHEPVSINDMVTTSLGGIAIGEPITQLSAFVERSGTGGALAWLAFPKKVHDLIDRARPAQLPDPGWHEFRAFTGVGPLWQGSGEPGLAFQASLVTGIFRLAGYGAPGRGTSSLGDAEMSRLGLSLTYGGGGLLDARFRSGVSLWGLYHRDILGEGVDRRGSDLFLGTTASFDYQYHQERLPAAVRGDQMILLQVPGAELDYRAFAGSLALRARARAALTFGGVRPLAFDGTAALPPGVVVPEVMSRQGYYHSGGFAVGVELGVDLGPAGLSGGVGYDRVWAFQGLEGIPVPGTRVEISDARLEAGALATVRLGGSGVEVLARWDRRVRRGDLGASAREVADDLLVAGMAMVF
jgi:hypothetical protein